MTAPDSRGPRAPQQRPAPRAAAARGLSNAARASRPAAGGSGLSLPLAQLIEAAADLVGAVRAGQSLTEALTAVDSRARPGAQALAFHALRWMGGASAARSQLVSRAPAPWVDAVLLVSLALLWPGAPVLYDAHTVVDQAVAGARRRVPASAGFVNAVLRRFLREREALATPAAATGAGGVDLVALHQYPAWWIARVKRDWPQQWEALLAAGQHHPPMALRVNARRMDGAAYRLLLQEAGLDAVPVGSHGLVLTQPVGVQRLPGFELGWVSVQDVSAQLAAPLLVGGSDAAWPRLPDGARVLDACAAPGGKTAHLLELADLNLVALDSDAQRLTRVADTLARIGQAAPLPSVQLVAADAGDPDAWWDGQPFDAILLDAPCSASGIVRRHPDVRWLRRDTDIASLGQQQTRLLDSLWPLLRPGGRLVYATCSVFRAEGEAQVEAFLQRTEGVQRREAPGHLLPLAHNPDKSTAVSAGGDLAAAVGDGFFYACLERAG